MSDAPKLGPGDALHGFVVRQRVTLEELNLTLVRLDHDATGAQLVHLACDDDNNLFGVAFKTPPKDSTGVAHILEHTVLCGSRRYPVRDPFFSMLKRSLNTFMNALTSSDWTLYPFSSRNRKDFYNLLDVYLDAAFFPLLRPRDFAQEGHRIEFSVPGNPSSPLEYKGVVYNEMKGAMADPASLLPQRLAEHLFPSTTYRYNSGGEPDEIPTLSFEDLRNFHERYYHPSNAYFFTYGNFDLDDHLRVIEARVLSGFGRATVDSVVLAETRFGQARTITDVYPAQAGEPLANRSLVQVGWLTSDIQDQEEVLGLQLLSSLLLGNPGAPLYKSLMDSKLGANLAPGTGYHEDYRTTYFAAGLQGTDSGAAEKVQDQILSTLAGLAKKGFARQRIDGAIHRMEFAQREVTGDHYPYPLGLMMRLLGSWIHCDDPVSPLRLSEILGAVRRKVDEGGYFEGLIRKWLLDNTHRVTLTLRPDPERGRTLDEEVRRRLDGIRQTMNDDEAAAIVAQAEALRKAQEAEEDLSCLPNLEVSDIPRKNRDVPWTRSEEQAVPVYWFDQPTNGIGYFSAVFDAGALDDDLVPFVPLFCSMLTQVGAGKHGYVEMAERIEAGTGGIHGVASVLSDPADLFNHRSLVSLRGKALIPKQQEMFGILGDVLRSPDFSDLDRLGTLLGQIRTSLENSVPGSGHSYARGDAAGALSPGARLREQWSGLRYLRFVKELSERGPDGVGELGEKLRAIAVRLLAPGILRASVAGEERHFSSVEKALAGFPVGFRTCGDSGKTDSSFQSTPLRRGWATSVPVSYVARVFPGVSYTHEDAATLKILARLLKASFLHREIREKGGAYGGMALYGAEAGLFSFVSYRDPHIARTLSVYDEAAAWAAAGGFDGEQIKEATLAVFGDLDRPLSPAGRAAREFGHLCQGLDKELRQRFRDSLFSVSREGLIRCARQYLMEGRSRSAVSVVSNKEILDKANRELGPETLDIEPL